jgi:hypothetical protein
MDIKTADGKQNFKLSSIWFYSKLSSPSGLKFFSRRLKLCFFAVLSQSRENMVYFKLVTRDFLHHYCNIAKLLTVENNTYSFAVVFRNDQLPFGHASDGHCRVIYFKKTLLFESIAA